MQQRLLSGVAKQSRTEVGLHQLDAGVHRPVQLPGSLDGKQAQLVAMTPLPQPDEFLDARVARGHDRAVGHGSADVSRRGQVAHSTTSAPGRR